MLIIAIFASLFSIFASAETDVRMSVGGSGGAPLPVMALPPFLAANTQKSDDALFAKDVHDIVRSDLMLSRRFDVKDEEFNAPNTPGASWRVKVTAGVAADKATAQVRLESAASGDAIFERSYRLDKQWPRALAHRISDDIVKAATGRDGFARTRIAFVNNQTGHKEVYVMDYDGMSVKRLTDDKSIDLLPRFAPDATHIAYTSYKNGNPDLFLLNTENGSAANLSADQGLNVAGGYSKDGRKLLMTLSRGKSPNLYMKDISSGKVERLTHHFGADSTPTFSPDARQVAFVSDRSGNPEIYLLTPANNQTRRLTNLNWCDNPAWSPTGEWIVFAGRANPKDPMDLFLVDITGTQIRQITHGEGSNEDPTWSPDGRLIAFSSTRDGRSRVYVVDADGSTPRPAADVPGESTTPTWSAVLP